MKTFAAAAAAGMFLGFAEHSWPKPAGTEAAGDRQAVAEVNGDPIPLGELKRSLASLHEGAAGGEAKAGIDPSEVLDRLVTARLIVQEAATIGLDDLPEVRKSLEAFRKSTLRKMLLAFEVRNITSADAKEVERRYRDAVKEVKVSSVLVKNGDDAGRFAEEAGKGGDFRELASRIVAEGKAETGDEGVFLKTKELVPAISKALAKMKPGEVSPPVAVEKGFAVVKLEEVRFPDDPEMKERVRLQAVNDRRVAAVKAYSERLKKKTVKVDEALLGKLDFETGENAFDAALRDRRTVARVKGGAPVTVSDLAGALREKFFHGVETAGREKKINRKKAEVLDELVMKTVFDLEARKQRIDRTGTFREMEEENRRSVLFAAFLRNVIEPGVKVEDSEVEAWRDAHPGEYTLPETLKIRALAFRDADRASEAAEKLKKGADFRWMRENAVGQAAGEQGKSLLDFPEDAVSVDTLPEGVKHAVAGAKGGDYRLYADPGGIVYVLFIAESNPPRPLPYESVKDPIRARLQNEKRQKAVEEYAGRLRASSEIRILVPAGRLKALVSGSAD